MAGELATHERAIGASFYDERLRVKLRWVSTDPRCDGNCIHERKRQEDMENMPRKSLLFSQR